MTLHYILNLAIETPLNYRTFSSIPDNQLSPIEGENYWYRYIFCSGFNKEFSKPDIKVRFITRCYIYTYIWTSSTLTFRLSISRFDMKPPKSTPEILRSFVIGSISSDSQRPRSSIGPIIPHRYLDARHSNSQTAVSNISLGTGVYIFLDQLPTSLGTPPDWAFSTARSKTSARISNRRLRYNVLVFPRLLSYSIVSHNWPEEWHDLFVHGKPKNWTLYDSIPRQMSDKMI